jgi:cell division protein FtsI (penicillin-binding protein 3)
VGVFKIILGAYENNPDAFIKGIYRMGLNKPLGLEIRGEGKPYIKNPEDKTWSGISLPWISIGYEMAITPLQILTFYNAVANNGKMVKPIFVRNISRTGEVVKEFDPQVINPQIASPRTIKIAQEMLEGVVKEGTAVILKSSPYPVAGKTGTAQTNYSRRQGRMRYRASFVGYFPADNPRYSIIVVINNPKGPVYYASQLTVPVFKDIADKIYARNLEIQHDDTVFTGFSAPASLYGDQNDIRSIYNSLGYQYTSPNPEAPWCAAVPKKDIQNIGLYIRNYNNGILPSLKGMNARDAIFFLEGLGYHVDVEGFGKVTGQSVPPGTRVQQGGYISLTLN